METFNLAQLTKEMVVGQIRNLADPTLVAAEVVRGTLIARLKGHKLSNHEIQEAVIEVCKGAMAALVLMECPLPRGASQLVISAKAAAQAINFDEELVVIGAVRGIADVKRFTTPQLVTEISERLHAAQPELGGAFDRFTTDFDPHQSHPGYTPPKV
jgi:hypothetical protein